MDKKISILISLFLILPCFIQSSLASSQNSTLDSQGNYANPSLGIVFQAPPGWTVEEPKKSQPNAPDITVIAPYSSGFTASISFIVEKANGSSLDDYVKNKENQLTSDNKSNNINFISEQDLTIDGFPAKASIIEENFSSTGSNNIVEFNQTVILVNDNFYTITYADDLKNYVANLSNYDQLLNSVKFSNNENPYLIYLLFGIAGIASAVGLVIKRKRSRPLKNA